MKNYKRAQQLFSFVLAFVLLVTTVPISVLTVNAVTTQFAGGNGSAEDPFLIETKEHLNNVRNDLGAHYKMIADIVFTDADFAIGGRYYNNGRGWSPIGFTEYEPFAGTFNGDGHFVEGLQLTRYDATRYAGLFGWCDGTVKNLGIINSSIEITAKNSYEYVYVGSIAGHVGSESTIINCWSNNVITAHTLESESYSRAYAGGIVGMAEGTANIRCCYNIGDVSANAPGHVSSAFCGGIIGGLGDGGNVDDSQILNCYNIGKITGDGDSGGIAGRLWQGSLEKCYNIGTVDGANAGAIAGYIVSKATVTNNYFLNNISSSVGNGASDNTNISCTAEQMAKQATFSGFNFENTWEFVEGNYYTYPTLIDVKYFVISESATFNSGDGTADSPYCIANKNQLNNIRNSLDSHFKLVRDIAFTDADFEEGGDFYNNGVGWEPIGSKTNAFTGVFDGNGKTISKLKINSHDVSEVYTGLFGYNCGDISDISLVNIEINAETTNLQNESKAFVGGVAGYSSGNISDCVCSGIIATKSFYSHTGGIVGYLENGSVTNCHNSSKITGAKSESDVGGIAGYSKDYITDCSNIGNIVALTTYSNAGGIVGYQNGSYIRNCYNLGSISAADSHHLGMYAGGITGYDWEGEIVDCFNIGSVRGSQDVGGIAGYLYYGTIQTCYNIGEVSGTGSWKPGGIVAAQIGDISNCYYMNTTDRGVGTGLDKCVKCTPQEMLNINTYEGFDFENIWEFKSNNAFGYPTLRINPYFKEAFEVGSGTENDPYLIKTAEELNRVRNYRTAYFKMISDITFTASDFAEGGAFYNSGAGWLPIGTDYDSPFTGCFDGNHHKISNLYINITEVPENGQIFAGLFGYGNGCQISNLSLKNSDITVDVTDAAVCAGAILGRTDEFGTGAIITNCTNDGKIYASTGDAGGIAGSFEQGTITGCENYGTIDGATASAGGIIGYLNQGAVTDCKNNSSIGSGSDISGLCGGIVASSSANILSCTNYGTINSSYDAGGIVGSSWGLIDNCRNDGKITAKYSAGGIAAVSASEQNGDATRGIKNCINTGTITAGIASDDMYFIKAGGIAGSIQNGISVSNSYNYGEVLSQTELVLDCGAGGIVGYNSGGYILKCVNIGNITVKTQRYARGGGIVGCNCGGNIPIIVDQCFNQGAIYSPVGNSGVCGGIAGDNYDTATISNCFNIGAITSSSRPGGYYWAGS